MKIILHILTRMHKEIQLLSLSAQQEDITATVLYLICHYNSSLNPSIERGSERGTVHEARLNKSRILCLVIIFSLRTEGRTRKKWTLYKKKTLEKAGREYESEKKVGLIMNRQTLSGEDVKDRPDLDYSVAVQYRNYWQGMCGLEWGATLIKTFPIFSVMA